MGYPRWGILYAVDDGLSRRSSKGEIVKDQVGRLTRLGVVVLALLQEGEMHPYEMFRLLHEHHDDRLVSITSGTLYHTVSRLHAGGLLSTVGVDRDGGLPERTTYALSDAGVSALREWVRRELPRDDHPAEFRIALAEAHSLERDEVADLLAQRRAALATQHDLHAVGFDRALAHGVPEQYVLEIDRQRQMLRVDLEWTDRLIDRLAAGELPWRQGVTLDDSFLTERKVAWL